MSGREPYMEKKLACTNWKDMTGYNNRELIAIRKNKHIYKEKY